MALCDSAIGEKNGFLFIFMLKVKLDFSILLPLIQHKQAFQRSEFSLFLLFSRLVLSRFEFEGVSTGENALEAGEDEEEVWLFWRDSSKEIRSKSVRELAQDAKEGQKEDRDVLSYYR